MDIPTNWTFETSGVAQGFDRHVREQLPWYDLATNAILHVARHYIPENGLVYDFGASTGNIGRALAPILKKRNAHLIGIEPSQEMIKLYKAPGEIICSKAETFIAKDFDLSVLFLCLMFIPPAKRFNLMLRLREKCKPGGAIIEKELSLSGVQRPITEDQLAGDFINWFKFGDFSGYLIEKPA